MIRAVSRALSILDAFDKDHLSLSLQEIGRRIGMPKATTFRLVNSLEQGGLLVRLDNQQYCLSLKLVRLAGMVRSTLSIRDIARPAMTEANRLTGETITLNTIDGNHRLCLEVIDTPAPLMSIARPGDHVPLLFGATSRILLAFMTDAERNKVLDSFPESRTLPRKPLERELARFRKQGYALTHSQRVQGTTAIAVPLRDVSDRVGSCLALTGPSGRVASRDAEFTEILLAAGNMVSVRLGAPPRLDTSDSHSIRAARSAGKPARDKRVPGPSSRGRKS